MRITNVVWDHDRRRRPALRLDLDGQPARFPSAQRRALLDRGIVQGMIFFPSEQRDRAEQHRFLLPAAVPGLSATDLAGCTDDPTVFALYTAMCQAITAGRWRPGHHALGEPERQAQPRRPHRPALLRGYGQEPEV
jgi:hypothetical protein